MKASRITILCAMAILIASTAYAGVLSTIVGLVPGSAGSIVAWAIGALVVVINKVIPNSVMKAIFIKIGQGLGVTITLGMSTWSWTKPIWNKTIEPFFIDLIDNIPIAILQGLILGMKTDNPE